MVFRRIEALPPIGKGMGLVGVVCHEVGGKSGAVWTELIQHPDGGLAPVVVFGYFLLSFLSLTRLLSTKVL